MLAALIIALSTFAPQTVARAETAPFYARAEIRSAYFCSSMSLTSALFAIPYTYCVQVVSEEGDWYYVKYAEDFGAYRALYGYCLKSTLTRTATVPSTVYLYKEIKVTYTADVGDSSLPVLGEITVTAAFYGTFYSGPTAYSYVLCQGTYGYVEGANDDYELLDYENQDASPPSDQPAPEQESPVNGKAIAGIALAVLAAVSILLLLVTGKKKRFPD